MGINHQVYDIYDDLVENTQLSKLVRALQINKLSNTFKDRVNNTHMNMKHKIIGSGSGSTKPRSETTTSNNFKTGPKILKERVMSVVTRMRNTNFTIIRENHNHDTTTSPEHNNLDKSVPDVNLHSSITSSATCGNLDSLKTSSSNSKNIKKKLKRRDKKNKSLDKLFDISHDNAGSSPVRSIFNRRKDSAETGKKS